MFNYQMDKGVKYAKLLGESGEWGVTEQSMIDTKLNWLSDYCGWNWRGG